MGEVIVSITLGFSNAFQGTYVYRRLDIMSRLQYLQEPHHSIETDLQYQDMKKQAQNSFNSVS